MKRFFTLALSFLYFLTLPFTTIAQSTGTATLSFSPTSGTITAGSNQQFSVNVLLNTGGTNSSGATVVVSYDASKLEFVSADSSYPTSDSTFYPNLAFGNKPVASGGKITMSRLVSLPLPGQSTVYTNTTTAKVFATLAFKALGTLPASNVALTFVRGTAADTVIAGSGSTGTGNVAGILGTSTDATYTIQAGSVTSNDLTGVSVSPASDTVSPLSTGTKTLTASITPTAANGVTYSWAVTGGGTLSATTGSSVIYTAGSSAGTSTVTVTATQAAANTSTGSAITKTGTSSLTVASGSDNLTSVSISPASSSLNINSSQTFTATANTSTGVTYAWSLSGVGSINSTSGSTITYNSGSTVGSATLTVTASKTGSTNQSATANITIGSVITTDPRITDIMPNSGKGDEDVQITIYGTNFGSAAGQVSIGSGMATIVSWTDTRVVVSVPKMQVSQATQTVVRLQTSGNKIAEFMGYTYLPHTGMPVLPLLSLIPLNGVLAWFIKKRFFA